VTLGDFIAAIPGFAQFSRKSWVLIFAYFLRRYRGMAQFTISDIRDCFNDATIKIPTDLISIINNLSFGRNAPLIRQKAKGPYALSIHGANEVDAILPAANIEKQNLNSFLDAAIPHLSRILTKVTDQYRRAFIAEAISCLEVGSRRATIILTWMAATDHLQEYVFTKHLTAFNTALQKRSDRASKITITTRDDFGELKESVFIETCRSAGIITQDVRKILDEKLGFRNSCAHPSSIQIGDSKVVSFIEDIIDNVFAKYTMP
jgi:hypothetical protein